MQHSKYIIVSIIVISALSFTINAFAGDGLTPGPGLFSGKSGEFSLTHLISKQATGEERTANHQSQMLETVATSHSERDRKHHRSDQKSEFSAYKQWHKLHQQNPDLYDNFELWLEYQSYIKTR